MNVLVHTIEEGKQQTRSNRGEGRIWRRGRIWWIQYWSHGRQVRESSHSDLKDAAKRLLRQRLGEVAAGIFSPPRAARIAYEQLRDALIADYSMNRRKWLRRDHDGKPYICGISRLDNFFAGWRSTAITTDAIRSFIKKQQEEGAANGTVNRSLALLRRMFRLAVEDGKLRDVPHFPMLREAPPRKGFLEYAEFQRLRIELPEHLRPVATVGYYTGMRLGEILGLRWENVSLTDGEIRLDTGSTKNDEPRTIPLSADLLEMLKIERQKNPGATFVFVHDGKRIGSFYKAWQSASRRAGLGGLLFHDLRRTGIRNLVRAGVPERVAMAISGHKTRAVFERYNIVSGRDLRDAMGKLESYLARQVGDNSGTIGPSESAKKNGQIEKVQHLQ
jgi:integrase